jgi:hypothetical protein
MHSSRTRTASRRSGRMTSRDWRWPRAASARYGWPLHVIERAGDDPATEQPERFLEVLQLALA